jgi:hypothetical protein
MSAIGLQIFFSDEPAVLFEKVRTDTARSDVRFESVSKCGKGKGPVLG